MKVKKVNLITEEARNINGVDFLNSTEDQFPYVEAALNSLDDNFNWWKENYPTIEQMIAQYAQESIKKSKGEFDLGSKSTKINISSRFTMFHGSDEKVNDVIWSGPAIVYSFNGISPAVVRNIKNMFGGTYKGRKIFADENQLIFLFG